MADILVSDDQNFIRMLLKKILEHEGHNVILSENGDKTLELLKQNKPSIVITDIFMPGEMNGEDVINELKSNYPEINVIAMSASENFPFKEAKPDIFMPGEMNGEDVINELKSNYPEINVIAMSASENFPFKEARPDIFMEKPFKGHELIHAVNSLLSENPAVSVGEV